MNLQQLRPQAVKMSRELAAATVPALNGHKTSDVFLALAIVVHGYITMYDKDSPPMRKNSMRKNFMDLLEILSELPDLPDA